MPRFTGAAGRECRNRLSLLPCGKEQIPIHKRGINLQQGVYFFQKKYWKPVQFGIWAVVPPCKNRCRMIHCLSCKYLWKNLPLQRFNAMFCFVRSAVHASSKLNESIFKDCTLFIWLMKISNCSWFIAILNFRC